jgi:4-hydroxy-tetrahydrodipicolinate synthase
MKRASKITEWKGIIGVPMTAFTPGNELDAGPLKAQVDFLIERKAAHILAYPMHISEALEMSEAERKRALELVIDHNNGRLPIIAHVSAPGTDNAVAFAKHARDAGADAMLSTLPYNWGAFPAGIKAHYEKLLNSVDLPLFMYNPAITYYGGHNQIPPQLIYELASKYDNLVGIKEASWYTEYFFEVMKWTSKLPRKFAVFAGIEHLVQTMSMGAVGSFSALNLIFPGLVKRLYELCEREAYVEARPLQYRASELLITIKRFKMHSAVKAMMEMQGRPIGQPRQPNLPLSSAEKESLVATLKDIGVWPLES